MKSRSSEMLYPVITIDGPSASGKSSLSRALAAHLGWNWVSTGAFYRGLAYVAFEKGVAAQEQRQLEQLCHDSSWRIEMTPDLTKVIYNNQDVTPQISHEDVGMLASQVSRYPTIRAALLQAQRDCQKVGPGLIAEGRDCGSVVFPEATIKFFLTANSADRALRRATEQGLSVDQTVAAQKQRDEQDSKREAAPLMIPEGAEVIDSSQMSLDQVVTEVIARVERRLGQR